MELNVPCRWRKSSAHGPQLWPYTWIPGFLPSSFPGLVRYRRQTCLASPAIMEATPWNLSLPRPVSPSLSPFLPFSLPLFLSPSISLSPHTHTHTPTHTPAHSHNSFYWSWFCFSGWILTEKVERVRLGTSTYNWRSMSTPYSYIDIHISSKCIHLI